MATAPSPAPSTPTTKRLPTDFTQLLHSTPGTEVRPDAKYIFGVSPVKVVGHDRCMVGVVMTGELAAELAAIRSDPRIQEVPALRALLGHCYRASRPTFEKATPST